MLVIILEIHSSRPSTAISHTLNHECVANDNFQRDVLVTDTVEENKDKIKMIIQDICLLFIYYYSLSEDIKTHELFAGNDNEKT
jgi:hypothetical protein